MEPAVYLLRTVLSIATGIAMEDNVLESGLMRVGRLTPFTCPECHGTLLQLNAGRFLHFRCHVGHAQAQQMRCSNSGHYLGAIGTPHTSGRAMANIVPLPT